MLSAVLAALTAGLLLARAVSRQVLRGMQELTRLAAGDDAVTPGTRFGLLDAASLASALRLAALDQEAASTERERLVAQLARERARLAAGVDATPVGLVFAEGPGGRIVGGNLQMAAIMRHPVWSSLDVRYRRAVSEGIPVVLEHHYCSEVHDIWLDVRAYPTEEGLAVFAGTSPLASGRRRKHGTVPSCFAPSATRSLTSFA